MKVFNRFLWIITGIFILGLPISFLLWLGPGLVPGFKIALIVLVTLWVLKFILWIKNKVSRNKRISGRYTGDTLTINPDISNSSASRQTSTSSEPDFVVDMHGVASRYTEYNRSSTIYSTDVGSMGGFVNADDFINVNMGPVFQEQKQTRTGPAPGFECPECHSFSVVQKPSYVITKPHLQCLACGWEDFSSLTEFTY